MDPMPAADPTLTRVFVVLNPVARGAEGVRRAVLAAEPDATILTTTVADPGAGQARQALAAGASRIIVAGGDGTVRLVAGVLAGTGIPLGIVPIGTANLFARNVGLRPRRPDAAVATALTGRPRPIDLGWARLRTEAGWSGEQPFGVLAGIGHDAATVLDTRGWLKRRVRWLAYFESGARHLLRRPVPMEIAADAGPARSVAVWCVLAANCGRLPGGVRIFADATPDDGRLHTLLVPLTSPWQWLGVAAKGLLRLHRDVAALTYSEGRTLTVRPAEPTPAQLDGDAVAGVTELHVRIDPGALLVAGATTGVASHSITHRKADS